MTPEGLLVVDKPPGPTSHDVVAQARRLFGTRAVGHAGTLDPMASGVLVLLIGEATKLTPYIALDDKEYLATVAFGRSTDTLDALGRTTTEEALEAGWLSADALALALDRERTRSSQIPPSFSAISIGGQRAHRMARRGEVVDLSPRSVRVRDINVVETSGDRVLLRVGVSKGYYVRSLARDLAESLGVPGHLAQLTRVASGPYRLEEALAWPPAGPVTPTPIAVAVSRVLPCVTLTAAGALRAAQGKLLTGADFTGDPPRDGASGWLDADGSLVAIGGPGGAEDGAGLRVRRGFGGRKTRQRET